MKLSWQYHLSLEKKDELVDEFEEVNLENVKLVNVPIMSKQLIE